MVSLFPVAVFADTADCTYDVESISPINLDSRQAKAYVSLKAPANAQVVAIEQVFGEEGEPVEGYEEHVYRLTLEDELTGKKTQRLMSIYTEVE